MAVTYKVKKWDGGWKKGFLGVGNGYILPEQGTVSQTLGVMSTIYTHSDKFGDRCRNQILLSLKTQYEPFKKLQWEFIALETGVISDLHFSKIV